MSSEGNGMKKDYLVHRHPSSGQVECSVVRSSDDGSLPPYMLPHLERHSPDGFEYGHLGRADLARSIVGDWLDTDDPPAHRCLVVLKAIIARLDQEEDLNIIQHDRLARLLGEPK